MGLGGGSPYLHNEPTIQIKLYIFSFGIYFFGFLSVGPSEASESVRPAGGTPTEYYRYRVM